MNKPNFFLAGAPRSATTTLYYTLKQHPNIFFPSVKEPSYFSERKKVETKEEYLSLYDNCDERILGDASTAYFYEFGAVGAIKDFVSNPYIFIQLRDPVERALSQYRLQRNRGEEEKAFVEACYDEYTDYEKGSKDLTGYVYRGLYYTHLERFFSSFQKNRIKITLFEDFIESPIELIKEVFEFLEVDSNFTPENVKKYNQSTEPRSSFLNNLIRKNSIMKKIAQRVLPTRLISYLSLTLGTNMNRSNQYKDYGVTEEDKIKVRKLFENDIQKLDELITKDVSPWLPSD